MNKSPEFAGIFYPAEAEELTNILNSYKETKTSDYESKAIIVPHAGYIFSGHSAMSAFQHLKPAENIFVIAPSHRIDFPNLVLPKFTFFDTPLGSIEVNNRVIKEIAEQFPVTISDEPFIGEHAIEVQLPFLQNILSPFSAQKQNAVDFVKNLKKYGKKFRIIPILVGRCDFKLISDIISTYWENSSFVISSDLSHFYTHEQCRQIDTYTATIIETGEIDLFEQTQACGLIGIKGIVNFANNNGFSMIRCEMYNSGDITNDKERVVGYGSWFLYEGTTNEFIEKNYTKYILSISRKCLISALNGIEYMPEKIPPVLTQYGASFATLYKSNKLRGCIGSVYPTKPLIIDILDNIKNASFCDSRFIPVTIDEINEIDISISLLSAIKRIEYKDEKDLLTKIYPYGIIICERGHRGVYLPVVWEQLPDREIFFNSLKEKTGLPPNYFSKTMEVYKFTATCINDEVIDG